MKKMNRSSKGMRNKPDKEQRFDVRGMIMGQVISYDEIKKKR